MFMTLVRVHDIDMHTHMHMHMHMHITHTPRLQDFDLEWLEAKIAGKR